MLTKKAKYAIKALKYLASQQEEGPFHISQIAEKEHIPQKFLETILLELRKNGFVSSKKGQNGGYQLIKDPDGIYLIDLLRIFDGPVAILPCASLNYYEPCDDCENEETCGLRKTAIELRDSSLKILRTTSIADVLKSETPARKK
jgi:Rrf2 family protein